jgi:cupin 2 domain-containing protein
VPERGNIFAGPPARVDAEVFDTLFEGRGVAIERIVSLGQFTPRSEPMVQQRDEWVVLLRGGARLLLEGEEEVVLGPGDYLHIPGGTRHWVTWTDPACESLWLAVHFDG